MLLEKGRGCRREEVHRPVAVAPSERLGGIHETAPEAATSHLLRDRQRAEYPGIAVGLHAYTADDAAVEGDLSEVTQPGQVGVRLWQVSLGEKLADAVERPWDRDREGLRHVPNVSSIHTPISSRTDANAAA